MRRVFVLLLMSLCTVSCAVAPPLPPFDANAAQLKTGKATVSGDAFAKQNGIYAVVMAGIEVFLAPDTPYFRAFVKAHDPKTRSPKANSFVRTAQTNSKGEFEFKNLGNGDYVVWGYESYVNPSTSRWEHLGGFNFVTVTADETHKVSIVLGPIE